MLLIREMLNKIEEDHQTKLQQLDSLKIRQDSLFITNNDSTKNNNLDYFSLNCDNTTETSNFNNLTLNDKERIAFQKEQQRRLNAEKPLVPETRTLNSLVNDSSLKAKDLTSTLINKNLNMLPNNLGSMRNNFSLSNISNPKQYDNNFNSTNSFQTSLASSSKKSDLSTFDSFVSSNLSQNITPKNSAMNLNGTSITNLNSNLNLWPSNNNVLISNNNTQNLPPSKQLSKSELEEFLN